VSRSVYGRGRQRCAGWRGGAGAIDIGPIKSDRPPPSSEAPPVTEIIQHRREHASRRPRGAYTHAICSRLTDERTAPTRWRLTTSTNHYTISNRRSWLDEPGGSPSTATHPLQRVHEARSRRSARSATGHGGRRVCSERGLPYPAFGGDNSEKERAHHMRDSFILVNQLRPVAAGGGWPAICAQTAMRLATRETCSRERRRGATSS